VPATILWDGGLTGQGMNWLDPVNWVGDVVPGTSDDAVIGPAGAGQATEITLTGIASVHSATVTGVTLSLFNTTFSGSLVNRGTIRTTSATVTASLANEGAITVAGDTTWNSPGDSTNSGTIVVSGGNLTLNQPAGAAFATMGTVTVGSGRTLAVNGGDYRQSAGTMKLGGTLNAGSLSQSGGTISLDVGGSLIVNGKFSQTGGLLDVPVGSQLNGTPMTSRIQVGAVALSGSLHVGNVGVVSPIQAYRIIDNVGPDPASGTFVGLPEGGRLMAGYDRIKISYVSGTGNDVVLTRDPPATFVWDGGPTGGGTDWFDPVNWEGDLVPINGDIAVIRPLPGPPTVVIIAGNTTAHVYQVKVEGTTLRVIGGGLFADLINSGTFEMSSGGGNRAHLWSGSITNAAGGIITTLAGSEGIQLIDGFGPIDNRGTVNIGTATTWTNRAALVNSGTINVSGGNLTLDQPLGGATFGTTGTINVAPGRSFTITGGTFTNFANNTLTGGTYNVAGTFRFPGAAIASLSADLTLDGPGATVLDFATSGNALSRLSTIAAAGRLTLRNGGDIPPPFPGGAIWNFGTLTVGTGCKWNNNIENIGTLTGSGVLPLINNDGGTVRPGEPVGTLTFNGSYNNAGGFYNGRGTLEIDVNGSAPGTGYDQVIVNAPSFLGGRLVVNAGYTAATGERLVVIDNRSTWPIVGTFDGLAEGAVLTAGGQDFRISYAGGDGNDVTLTRTGPVLPKVDTVRVNDGAAQRSRVTSLTVAFNTQVGFAGAAANAFVLTRDSDAAPVAFTATTSVTGGVTVVTLGQFAGAASDAGSLADGRYTLTVRAGQVSTSAGSLDGNRDGTPGDDYTAGGLHRLYGDTTADGWVDAADLSLLRQTFGRVAADPLYFSYLDADADGAVNGTDLARFRQAYYANPPRVSAVQVNDGSAQRSRVTSLTVAFSHAVTFAGTPAAAFVLTHEDGTPVTFAAAVTIADDATRVTLDHFSGPATELGSLADGRYMLKILASQVSTPGGALDGNADGTPGDDYSFGPAQGLVRKYGDGNGDGKVDAADLALFRQTFGRVAGDPLYLSWLDVNGDGAVNGLDLARFRPAYGGGG